jgi:Sporulation and spore germination
MKKADAYTAAGLLALFASVALTSPRWARLLRQPVRVTEEDGGTPSAPEPVPGPTASSGSVVRTINVKLFFEDPQGDGLVLEERGIAYQASLSRQLRVVVEELLRGSQSGNLAPWAGGARVLEVFVTARGVAYVDLSKEIATTRVPGTRAELLAVYSLVNSIVLNFPAIQRVQILIDGQAAETLAGHVDLSRPLPPDMTLQAAIPAPAPAGAGPASPSS